MRLIRKENVKMYTKFYNMWHSMMQRCYYPKNHSYHRYGGEGVFVDERWHNFENFIEDIDKVEGFNLEGIMNSELELDKDYKSDMSKDNDKKYSLSTCKFVSKSENSGNRRNNRLTIALDLKNDEVYLFKNREEFCRKNDINGRDAFNSLKNPGKVSVKNKRWYFFLAEEFDLSKIDKRLIIEKVNPENNEVIESIIDLPKYNIKNNYRKDGIHAVLGGRQKTYKGFTYKRKFIDRYKSSTTIERKFNKLLEELNQVE